MPLHTTISSASSLTSLIGAVVAPVALITADAILLSAFTAKYTSLSSQMRTLTAEYRNTTVSESRKQNIREQLSLFYKRVSSLWAASAFMILSLVFFLVTILAVVFLQKSSHLTEIGAITIISGLFGILAALALELYEIALARQTISGELSDIFTESTNNEI